MNIAIIPARGGSKRIPRKNIKNFHGKPIIAYSIEAALESGIFDRVIVSTDDHQISDVAKQYGAEVPFMRPEELSCDKTTTVPVIKHAIEEIENQTGLIIESACCIYAAAPFVNSVRINEAYQLLKSGNYDYSFPVSEFDYAVQRALMFSNGTQVSMVDPSQYEMRSQDLAPRYHDVGQLYFGWKQSWIKEKPILSAKSTCFKIPRKFSQDIDTSEDWEFSEFLYSYFKNRGDSEK